jgi:hypothetical protein
VYAHIRYSNVCDVLSIAWLRAELGCSGLAPEIVHFRIPSDGVEVSALAPMDWYIKGAK